MMEPARAKARVAGFQFPGATIRRRPHVGFRLVLNWRAGSWKDGFSTTDHPIAILETQRHMPDAAREARSADFNGSALTGAVEDRVVRGRGKCGACVVDRR